MKRFLTFLTAFVFFGLLVCSTAMPLVMAFGGEQAMEGCPQGQMDDGSSGSACDHSSKVNVDLGLNSFGGGDVTFKLTVLAPALLLPAVSFDDSRAVSPAFQTKLLSHLPAIHTVVLRF